MVLQIENAFNNVLCVVFLRELQEAGRVLSNLFSFVRAFYESSSLLYYQHGPHSEGVTVLELVVEVRQGDISEGLLFAMAHFWVIVSITMAVFGCFFSFLADDTHIVRLAHLMRVAFDTLITQLALVELNVKVSKYCA